MENLKLIGAVDSVGWKRVQWQAGGRSAPSLACVGWVGSGWSDLRWASEAGQDKRINADRRKSGLSDDGVNSEFCDW